MPELKRILIVEDDDSLRESLEMFLCERGYEVTTAATGEEGLTRWGELRPPVIILDIKLPDLSGLEVLPRIVSQDPEVKVIVVTAFHDMETTIEAMRLGAYDYVQKPFKAPELDAIIAKALHIVAATLAHPPVVSKGRAHDARRRIIGDTSEMNSIFKTIGLLSRNRATVLVTGETGSGKELIARVIHDSSQDSAQPFVTVDCTTLVSNLMESELFGHERGAFTGAVENKKGRLELAGQGTIFFDEVGELPLLMQAKLLRFLENREFTRVGGTQVQRSQARIVAATNRNLKELVREGCFRQDLLFRLKVVTIEVPPLRERQSDLPQLVRYFLGQINEEFGLAVDRVEDQALARLAAHDWPGNVRELKNVLTKAAMDSRGPVLLAEVVAEALASSTPEPPPAAARLGTLEEVEHRHILFALNEHDWNISATARALGISRPTLRKRMSHYSLYRKA
ncbi:MAG: sigma-54 dependent transcriptional regulator [Deltaproteobacteria bacterium]|nr:sigma-54 dependent transcriptional regulator [Deltaproteobacteria bacterium]